jgi:hypothetical protein
MTQIVDLIPILLEKSREDKINWEPLSSGSIVARFDEFSVELTDSPRGHVRIIIRDNEGRLLESTRWEELGKPYDDALNDLHALARRQALQIDKALDAIKSKLDKL